ncbi:MAG TPA: protein-L-isoaspartate(D-aspartate) O-methyltransferase [Bryobacteraceae bacterium]|nr:protein-L-isoaspartate(D-aspartate) O-methyltransferase [Bryobacteraceae bacterium]
MIPDWPSERGRMVDRQLRKRGIRDPRVLDAMLSIPREEFVPPDCRICSYQDEPLQIGYGQTISQPYMIALMAELLELTGTETVLEVGTGCGYHAAVLGALAARVITVELIPGLARLAEENLKRASLVRNITVVCGDGSLGWPDAAPYAAISVAAAAPDVPELLLSQLGDPGRLVIPVGDRFDQELRVIAKSDGVICERVATFCRFVPLRGGAGWR